MISLFFLIEPIFNKVLPIEIELFLEGDQQDNNKNMWKENWVIFGSTGFSRRWSSGLKMYYFDTICWLSKPSCVDWSFKRLAVKITLAASDRKSLDVAPGGSSHSSCMALLCDDEEKMKSEHVILPVF